MYTVHREHLGKGAVHISMAGEFVSNGKVKVSFPPRHARTMDQRAHEYVTTLVLLRRLLTMGEGEGAHNRVMDASTYINKQDHFT